MTINVSVDADLTLPSKRDPNEPPYKLLAFPFPPGHFRVHQFRGVEAISTPYAFDITVTSAVVPGLDVEEIVLGQRAVFTLRVGKVARAVHGIVRSVRSEGLRQDGTRTQHRVRLVPYFDLLRYSRRSRVFQNLSVPEVVEQVLSPATPIRWSLTREYPKRAYITQYEESDKAFVERLLAEAGIFYYFIQPSSLIEGLMGMAADELEKLGPLGEAAGAVGALAEALLARETMVFGDEATAYLPIDDGNALSAVAEAIGVPTAVQIGPVTVGLASPTLRYFDQHGLVVERFDAVTAFMPVRSVRTTHAEFRDYDPDRPNLAIGNRVPSLEEGSFSAVTGGLSASIAVDPTKGVDVSAGLSFDFGAFLGSHPFEDYQHHGRFHFPDPADSHLEADRVLARARRRVQVGKGRSLSTGLVPGFRFALEDHPLAGANRDYAVVRVRHRGANGLDEEIYENAFECVPAETTYPSAKTRRKTVQATVTATVACTVLRLVFADG